MITKFVIYKIYWPRRGYFYYGKTRGFRKRRNRHLRELQDGTHHNCNLLKAFSKYGLPKIKIIAYCSDDAHLAEVERCFVSAAKTHAKCCNIQVNLT